MPKLVSNPPNPWTGPHVEWIDAPPPAGDVQVHEEEARSILSHNDSPDLPFRWSVNPYRGCFHACSYCYARPSHQYLDWGAGTDFERRLVAKVNAARLLDHAFASPSWKGELVMFSGNTDCYQPLESTMRLTRACLEVCVRHRNPVGIITKGALIQRDVDVLQDLAACAHVHVNISLPVLDAAMARALEPGAPSPRTRLQTIEVLAAAGISVGVGVAPIIPGLNDDQIAPVLQAARDAGATRAWYSLLRLPPPVDTVFVERLRQTHPLRVDRVMHALHEARPGTLTSNRPIERMHGHGPRWAAAVQLFHLHSRRLGFILRERADDGVEAGAPARPTGAQLGLFEGV